MLSFPNAKINIGLNITAKREDGYHELETIFYPVDLCDVLEFVPSETLHFISSGIPVPGPFNGNLCLKAFELLRSEHELPFLDIHLHKYIPIGAGLGGGSADAAFFIKQVNAYFKLGLSPAYMEQMAGKLGADCPFFIQNKPVFATGTGNIFEEIGIDLSSFSIVLAVPDLHISTSDAFQSIVPRKPAVSLKELIYSPPHTWKENIRNDFEPGIFDRHPVIREIRDHLYASGAVYASLSGTGSAVYGLFEKPVLLLQLEKVCSVYYA